MKHRIRQVVLSRNIRLERSCLENVASGGRAPMMSQYALVFCCLAIAACPAVLGAPSAEDYLRCEPFDDQGRKVGKDAPCPRYRASILQLLTRPELFDGKRVGIEGYVHLEFEGRGVYVTEADRKAHL